MKIQNAAGIGAMVSGGEDVGETEAETEVNSD